jgi:hypothetical protein
MARLQIVLLVAQQHLDRRIAILAIIGRDDGGHDPCTGRGDDQPRG